MIREGIGNERIGMGPSCMMMRLERSSSRQMDWIRESRVGEAGEQSDSETAARSLISGVAYNQTMRCATRNLPHRLGNALLNWTFDVPAANGATLAGSEQQRPNCGTSDVLNPTSSQRTVLVAELTNTCMVLRGHVRQGTRVKSKMMTRQETAPSGREGFARPKTFCLPAGREPFDHLGKHGANDPGPTRTAPPPLPPTCANSVARIEPCREREYCVGADGVLFGATSFQMSSTHRTIHAATSTLEIHEECTSCCCCCCLGGLRTGRSLLVCLGPPCVVLCLTRCAAVVHERTVVSDPAGKGRASRTPIGIVRFVGAADASFKPTGCD
ncbi:hypothetical protein LX32DRAFT_150691 [Colletotrichum zoysiae]|uniref:Uncharacterized protein n=1 Tax=Colletotrichum zoysiae TaxID=1216348 RepID=A0AAD9MAG0_9PEZI|nr:hypothetical protein LX32DRAFT_150691 [Colletotrichum zoysiae]